MVATLLLPSPLLFLAEAPSLAPTAPSPVLCSTPTPLGPPSKTNCGFQFCFCGTSQKDACLGAQQNCAEFTRDNPYKCRKKNDYVSCIAADPSGNCYFVDTNACTTPSPTRSPTHGPTLRKAGVAPGSNRNPGSTPDGLSIGDDVGIAVASIIGMALIVLLFLLKRNNEMKGNPLQQPLIEGSELEMACLTTPEETTFADSKDNVTVVSILTSQENAEIEGAATTVVLPNDPDLKPGPEFGRPPDEQPFGMQSAGMRCSICGNLLDFMSLLNDSRVAPLEDRLCAKCSLGHCPSCGEQIVPENIKEQRASRTSPSSNNAEVIWPKSCSICSTEFDMALLCAKSSQTEQHVDIDALRISEERRANKPRVSFELSQSR